MSESLVIIFYQDFVFMLILLLVRELYISDFWFIEYEIISIFLLDSGYYNLTDLFVRSNYLSSFRIYVLD